MSENLKDRQCHICDKIFSTKSNLRAHFKNKTPCNQRQPVNTRCDRCLKVFSSSSRLKYHINKKTPCIAVITLNDNNIDNNTDNDENKIKDNNIVINNTKNITNNTKNETNYNNSNNTNNLIIINTNNEPLDITKINEILKKSDFKDKYVNLLTLSSDNITDKNNIKTHILDIIDEINELLKILYVDYNNKSGHIFRIDIDNISTIYVKKNMTEIDKLDDKILLYIIYESFKSIIIEYKECLDKQLFLYYKRFIKAYENGDFINIDTDDNIKNFISEIRNKLADDLLELYTDLQKYNNKSKAYKNAKIRQSEFIKHLKQKKKNNDADGGIKYIGYILKMDDLNTIFNRLKSYKIIKIFNENLIPKENYYILSIIEYFINMLYISNKAPPIKLEKNSFYIYVDNSWIKLDQSEFIKNEINKYINKLKDNNIIYDEIRNEFIESYDDYDYEQLKYNIEDNYRGGFVILHYTFQYIFKYNKFQEYISLNKSIIEL